MLATVVGVVHEIPFRKLSSGVFGHGYDCKNGLSFPSPFACTDVP